MLKDQLNKFKNIIIKENQSDGDSRADKRKTENMIAFLVILIVTIIAINTIIKSGNNRSSKQNENLHRELATDTSYKKTDENENLEKKIKNILETMAGVRKG